MNDPTKQPIDIEVMRVWLRDHKAAQGLSWAQIAKRMGIAAGTISQFGGGGYAGDNLSIAQKVYRYQQALVQQATISIEAPEVPGFFECPTSQQLITLLHWGQRGRIVVAAMGPGCCKTMTARHFADCGNNVFYCAMTPSTAGVANMQQEVLAALGEPDAIGTPQKLSRRIRDRVKDLQSPLIIIDEAQHLSEKAIDEIRSWYDAVGVGVALFGNLGVMQRLEGGSRKAAFAQLFSRIGMRIVRPSPLQADADALAAAWQVSGDDEVAQIRKVVMLPGGMRGATMMLELAYMLAASQQDMLKLEHLQDAWAQLSSKVLAS
jgi:DNA transposition AAA+ family ATPase